MRPERCQRQSTAFPACEVLCSTLLALPVKVMIARFQIREVGVFGGEIEWRFLRHGGYERARTVAAAVAACWSEGRRRVVRAPGVGVPV